MTLRYSQTYSNLLLVLILCIQGLITSLYYYTVTESDAGFQGQRPTSVEQKWPTLPLIAKYQFFSDKHYFYKSIIENFTNLRPLAAKLYFLIKEEPPIRVQYFVIAFLAFSKISNKRCSPSVVQSGYRLRHDKSDHFRLISDLLMWNHLTLLNQ